MKLYNFERTGSGTFKKTGAEVVLFSYGSNGPEQIAKRIGKNVVAFPAYAEGFRRVYRGWSRNWGGGPASLIKKRGAIVYGSAALLPPADVHALAKFEGVQSGNYSLVTVPVKIDIGSGFMTLPNIAVAFVSNSDEWNAPSQKYLKAIAKNVGAFWSGSGGKPKPSDFYNEE